MQYHYIAFLLMLLITLALIYLMGIFYIRYTGQVGLWVGSWPSNRRTRDQVSSIILRDLTQECRKKYLIGTDITV